MDDGCTPTVIRPEDPNEGKTLANEFRLLRLLGRGGMGAVYLAEQISLLRTVAVKLLPLDGTDVAKLDAKLKEYRARIVEASKPTAATEEAWRGLASEVWKLGCERRWSDAVRRCQEAGKDATFSLVQERIKALAGAMEHGERANEEIVRARRSRTNTEFTCLRVSGAEVSGTLVGVTDEGDCRVAPKEAGGEVVTVPLSELPLAEYVHGLQEWTRKDASTRTAMTVWALAVGAADEADDLLSGDTTGEARRVLDPSAVGWKAPWSTEEVDRRRKEREATPPPYPALASQAWDLARARRWDEAYDLCLRARQDAKYGQVSGRASCLVRLMALGKKMDAEGVRVLKDQEGKQVSFPRRQGEPATGTLLKASDAGDLTMEVGPATIGVRFVDLSLEHVYALAREWLAKEDHALAEEAVLALAVQDYDTADALLTRLEAKNSRRSSFDIAAEGWDASSWSPSALEKRAKERASRRK